MATQFFPKRLIPSYNYYTPVHFSEHFYDFMDRKITTLFKQQTGLSPSAQLTTSVPMSKQGIPFYERGPVVSCLNFCLGICNTGGGYNFTFYWQSKSGKTVSIGDEVFDEDDLECWLENIKPELIYADLARYGKQKPPFKLKNLPFELEIRGYHYTMNLYITVTDENFVNIVSQKLHEWIVEFNDRADAIEHGRLKGASLQSVHSWKITTKEDQRICLYLDAASPDILKKLIKGLANFEQITKVEMDL